MSELREKLKVVMLGAQYQSMSGRGKRGFLPHHVDAILDTIMPVLNEQGCCIKTIYQQDRFVEDATFVEGAD